MCMYRVFFYTTNRETRCNYSGILKDGTEIPLIYYILCSMSLFSVF